jgi:hypothetical protein
MRPPVDGRNARLNPPLASVRLGTDGAAGVAPSFVMAPRRRFAATSFSSAAERRAADLFLADLLGQAVTPRRAPHHGSPAAVSDRTPVPVEEAWHENAIPEPALPARSPSAPTGSAFMRSIWGERAPAAAEWTRREEAMIAQLLAGNMPGWLRQWLTIEVKASSPNVQVRVTPDYLCVGDDSDFRHLPLDQHSAQRVADSFGACLPTAKICHAIYLAAPAAQRIGAIPRDYSVTPWTRRKLIKKDWAQTSTAAYDEHSVAIQNAMTAGGIRPGQLVAGHKKDVVLSNRLHQQPRKIAFHGFYDARGYPFEPCYEVKGGPLPSCVKNVATLAHPEGRFSDYSQGVRLVHPIMHIDGALKLVREVLVDPALSPLISSEGRISPPRIPRASASRAAEEYGGDTDRRPCGCGGHK